MISENNKVNENDSTNTKSNLKANPNEISKISHYSNSDLHAATLNLVLSERRLSTVIIHHLKEIDQRRLWAEMAHSSLFEYCVQALHYSVSQAYRRISALRLIKEIPCIEAKIIDGSLNLTTVSQAQTFFRHEAKHEQTLSREEKVSVLERLVGKTQKEAELELVTISPSFARKPDQVRAISKNEAHLQFTASLDLTKVSAIIRTQARAAGVGVSLGLRSIIFIPWLLEAGMKLKT